MLTDEIAEYLPDSDVGRPSTLSTLVSSSPISLFFYWNDLKFV